jgi:hypothetical protein
MNRWISRGICGLLAIWLALAVWSPASAAGAAGWQTADSIQKALQQAQLALGNGDTATAAQLVDQAERTAISDLAPMLSGDTTGATQALTAALTRAGAAATADDLTAFAAAAASARTALFQIGALETQAALRADLE